MTRKHDRWLIAALLLAGVLLAFSPLLSRELHSEDERLLTRLEQLDGTEAVGLIFTRSQYREPLPLAALLLRVQQLAGMETTGFALTALALHAINTLLLLSLLRRGGVGTWPASLIAGAFALHPVQVENVARLSGQGELLAIGFVFLGLHLRERGDALAGFGLLGCLVAGALCSPTALLLPLLLVLLAPRPGEALVERIPQLVAGLLLGILLSTRTVHELAIWDDLYGIGGHIHHFASAIVLSLRDLAGPTSLSAFHVVPAPLPVWVPPVVLPLLILAVWAGTRRVPMGRAAILFGAALLFAAARGVLRFEFRADGWLALAVIGMAWMLVARFGRPGAFPKVAGVVVLASWAIMAHAQAGTWVTERALLDRAIEVEPANWQARTARAELAMIQGDPGTIETDAVAALVAQPRSIAAAFMLGYARGLAGDEYALQRLGWHGARTGWNDRSAELRLGYLFLEIGLDAEARILLERSHDDEALAGLALAAVRLGEPATARARLDRALANEPVLDEALVALAWLLATAPEQELRDPERALAYAERIEAPEFLYLALDARAAALAGRGRFADAYRTAQDAARRAGSDGYTTRADEIRDRALLYLGMETWTEPRGSAPAAHAEVDEQGDHQGDRGRDPGDR